MCQPWMCLGVPQEPRSPSCPWTIQGSMHLGLHACIQRCVCVTQNSVPPELVQGMAQTPSEGATCILQSPKNHDPFWFQIIIPFGT